ncbi:hypothetical protein PV327_007580 [Microctonus hyperodae]|uniref:Uncharacterized protein n=1 Tax=Microctonus hyperodae TaxID=165561 RepID=A0AA39FZH5_MICHY|nr:hypothetical protein PV327_007580 [Microctonus hyperodae]
MITIIRSRDALLDAFEVLLNTEMYRIQCEETKKFDIEGEKKSKYYAQLYSFFVNLSAATVIRSALLKIPARIIPFNGWFPFKHTDTVGFYVVFTYQIIMP